MFTNLILKNNRKNIFPFYHTVSNHVLPHIGKLYNVRNEKEFNKDLEVFCKWFQPVSLDCIINSPVTTKRPSFHLTFDDGLRECSEIVQPILLEKGIPATFFINNDFIDNKNLFYRFTASLIIEKAKTEDILKVLSEINVSNDKPHNFIFNCKHSDADLLYEIASRLGIDIEKYLSVKRPYMSTDEIAGIIKNGFTIGSHSCSHIDFSFSRKEEILAGVKNSIADINQRFGISVKAFSFPFTNHTIPVSVFNSLKNEIPEYQRIPMEKYTSDAKNIIAGELRNYRLKKMLGRHFVKRKCNY